MFFQKKLGAGLVGGEGFIMQKVTGPGLVFLEVDGYCQNYDLAPGERLVCDTGVLAVGKKADIIAIDLSKPHLYPNFDTPALLTCSAQAGVSKLG